jgi:hypothetical protein
MRQLSREARFACWDASARFDLCLDRLAADIRRRCPDFPFVDADTTEAMAPSVVGATLLWVALPVGVLFATRDPSAALGALLAGIAAFRVFDLLVLRWADGAHAGWWERSSERRRALAAQVMTRTAHITSRARRWAGASFAAGAGLSALALVAQAIDATPFATAIVALLGAVLLLVAVALLSTMLAGELVGIFAPTVMGPAGAHGRIVTRGDIATLRPLIETGPARVVRAAWELFRALRP